MIKIKLKNGEKVEWEQKDYDNYTYDGKCFIVIRNNRWVGFYNIDGIVSIKIED